MTASNSNGLTDLVKALILIALSILMMVCHSGCKVHKLIDKTIIKSDSIYNHKSDSVQVKKSESTATQQQEDEVTEIEAETPETLNFPNQADTSIEVVRILKSLPKGSKVKITHGKSSIIINSASKASDSTAVSKSDSGEVKKEKEEVHKKIDKEPAPILNKIILILSIAAFIIISIFLYGKRSTIKAWFAHFSSTGK